MVKAMIALLLLSASGCCTVQATCYVEQEYRQVTETTRARIEVKIIQIN